MISRTVRLFLYLILLPSLSFSTAVSANNILDENSDENTGLNTEGNTGFKESTVEFERFKLSQKQAQSTNNIKEEFAQYKAELERGFSIYQEAYEAAIKKEKKSVKRVWGDYRPGDNKRWVQYEKNTRQSVNFESGDVILEMIVDKQASNKKTELQLRKNIHKLLSITHSEAFKRDNIVQSVEQKLKSIPQIETAALSNEPVMGVLLSSSLEPKTASNYAAQAKADVRISQKTGKKIVRIKFKIPINVPRKSKKFIQTANKIANKEGLPLTLVMAVMENESAFNSMAKSSVPAYGLMQIVPRSAGQDATKYLFGKAKILSPSYLYDSDKNIEIGGAYLHILYFRYLAKIENPVSRLYCTIAAYNTGAGNVARAFIGTTNINRAAKTINQLTPKEVYQHLRKKLPYEETQEYLKKVSVSMQKYKNVERI